MMKWIGLKKKLKKIKNKKNSWYDWCNWLINYIPKPIQKQQIHLQVFFN